jgi:hypothetical protein
MPSGTIGQLAFGSLITVFRLQMKEFVDQLVSANLLSSWYTYSVYATSVFELFGQIIFGGAAVAIGELRHLCLFNLWCRIKAWAMLFCINLGLSLRNDE